MSFWELTAVRQRRRAVRLKSAASSGGAGGARQPPRWIRQGDRELPRRWKKREEKGKRGERNGGARGEGNVDQESEGYGSGSPSPYSLVRSRKPRNQYETSAFRA